MRTHCGIRVPPAGRAACRAGAWGARNAALHSKPRAAGPKGGPTAPAALGPPRAAPATRVARVSGGRRPPPATCAGLEARTRLASAANEANRPLQGIDGSKPEEGFVEGVAGSIGTGIAVESGAASGATGIAGNTLRGGSGIAGAAGLTAYTGLIAGLTAASVFLTAFLAALTGRAVFLAFLAGFRLPSLAFALAFLAVFFAVFFTIFLAFAIGRFFALLFFALLFLAMVNSLLPGRSHNCHGE